MRTHLLNDTNYIVSGLERSGTSLMMQILYKGGLPVAFDAKRKPDIHNPRGYFELEGGKIIRKLMEGKFDFDKYKGKFIKITAYGLKFLPIGKYKIIYMVRDLDEIVASMEKMSGQQVSQAERRALEKLNKMCLRLLEERKDVDFIVISYNKILENPRREISKVNDFLNGGLDVEKAMEAVDPSLYRNRKVKG